MESQQFQQAPQPPAQGPTSAGRPVPPAGLESLSGGATYAVPPDMPVRLSAHQTSPTRHFAKWLLAMIGVFALYLVLQIAVATVGGIVLAAVDLAQNGVAAGVDDALYNNGFEVILVVSQLIAIAVFLPWWRRVRPGSFGERRAAVAPKNASFAKTLLALALIGIGAQFFVSALLGLVEMLAPEAIAEYSEMIEDVTTGAFVLVSAIATTVLAPLNEELVCRGVMFEYAMRAVSPWWDTQDRARCHAVSARAFWVANILQALAFGILHMNLIQGSYAFALGVVQGWVFWRTGKLRYAVLLHFALNGSSYLVEPLAPFVNMLPVGAIFVLFGAMLAAGIWLFNKTWSAPDELSEHQIGDRR